MTLPAVDGKLPRERKLTLREAARKGTKGTKVIDIEATVEPSANGNSEAERGLKLGAPVEEQDAQSQEEPETVIRRKIDAWLEHYRFTTGIGDPDEIQGLIADAGLEYESVEDLKEALARAERLSPKVNDLINELLNVSIEAKEGA